VAREGRGPGQGTGSVIVTVQRDIVIQRPAREIFEALTNFGEGSRWYTGVVEAEHEPPGPIAEGTRITQVRLQGRRRELTRYLVKAYEPDRGITLESVGVTPPSTIRYGLAEAAPGVRLTCVIEVKTGGLLFRLVESRLRRDLDTKLGETLDTFCQAMERA